VPAPRSVPARRRGGARTRASGSGRGSRRLPATAQHSAGLTGTWPSPSLPCFRRHVNRLLAAEPYQQGQADRLLFPFKPVFFALGGKVTAQLDLVVILTKPEYHPLSIIPP